MAATDKPKPASAVPSDLLPVIRRSGILSDRQLDEIRAKVLRGDYPNDSRLLADRLIKEKLITDYQANRFLSNKSHGLLVGGRYVIVDRLGSGSMGRVYKAQHQLMGRLVALKIIAPDIVTNERVVARFQREMRLVGRLDHPNVVRAFDADQMDNVLFIVMEYVPGVSLAHRLRVRGPVPPADVVSYGAQAALGLGHAHAQGIVHRDIKPSNLLLTDDRQIKILDLGLGTLMEADSQATFATADGIAVGTIDYMSPEQACGKEVDGRSDLYSLGCAMYHLMTGLLAFPGDSPIERLGKRINGRPVPITDVMPTLPKRLVQTLDKFMAHKPHERFQTAEEAAEALQSLTRKRGAPKAAAKTAASSPAADSGAASPFAVVVTPPTTSPISKNGSISHATYPGWFRPLASLVERSPIGGLLLLLTIALVILGAGIVLGSFLL